MPPVKAQRPQPLQQPDACALLQQLSAGHTSAEQLVREHIDRLHAQHSRLNAATQVFSEQALEQARNPMPGPLFGLPISIKECFAMAGEQVTLGSRRMPPIQCDQDAAVVKKLRAAGAIIIARGNNPEMLMNAETDNLVFGRSNNPLDPSRVPGGSSGGDGALVGSGSVVFGVGTDILGSIRFPAAFCGVVGFKPSSGAIDKTGMYPQVPGFADSWNAPGPITRSVRDARLVCGQLADTPLDEAPPAKDLNLILPKSFPRSADCNAIEQARDVAEHSLLNAGLQPQAEPFNDVGDWFNAMVKFVIPGIIDPLRELLTDKNGKRIGVPAELIRQLCGNPSIYSGLFMWLLQAPLIRPYRAKTLPQIIQQFETARTHIHAMLGRNGVLLLPTFGLLAPKHGRMNRRTIKLGVNKVITAHTMANYLDLASITVPAWKHCDPATGLPPAIMLMSAPGGEAGLFAAAEIMEKALNPSQD